MTRLQRFQLAQSEKRSELGGLLDAETSDNTAIEAVSGELRQIETQIQAAILAGEDETVPETREEKSEDRELRSLIAGASIADYIAEAAGTVLTGESLELRSELLGDAHGLCRWRCLPTWKHGRMP